mmetsp:Transcript_1271/g.3441  ORF Transcript_1271/g.3441 Transcript_1271/m.3441 type:complete len:216 (+) Transcript_1271:5284-5931(+)
MIAKPHTLVPFLGRGRRRGRRWVVVQWPRRLHRSRMLPPVSLVEVSLDDLIFRCCRSYGAEPPVAVSGVGIPLAVLGPLVVMMLRVPQSTSASRASHAQCSHRVQSRVDQRDVRATRGADGDVVRRLEEGSRGGVRVKIGRARPPRLVRRQADPGEACTSARGLLLLLRDQIPTPRRSAEPGGQLHEQVGVVAPAPTVLVDLRDGTGQPHANGQT